MLFKNLRGIRPNTENNKELSRNLVFEWTWVTFTRRLTIRSHEPPPVNLFRSKYGKLILILYHHLGTDTRPCGRGFYT